MKLLLYSGLLYLTGVAIILILQPSLMFTEDGQWKEFGIGRGKTHTWMPFWLFSVVWAILSYIILLIIAGWNVLPGVSDTTSAQTTEEAPLSYRNFEQETVAPMKGSRKKASTPIPGYYILNREVTEETGVPKYIYLGPEPPGEQL